MLKYIEDTLLKNWNGYGGFEELQEKILRLRMILEETDGKATAQGDGYSKRRGFALIIGSLSLTTFIPNDIILPSVFKALFQRKTRQLRYHQNKRRIMNATLSVVSSYSKQHQTTMLISILQIPRC